MQYLIGKIRLTSWNSSEPFFIDEYHFVDLKDPSTHTFRPKDTILIDDYQNITLFLGFDDANNGTSMHPELNDKGFGWNPNWGGGYYTMKMYGNYFSTPSSSSTFPYDMALGGYKLKETPTDTTWERNELFATVTSQGFSIPEGTKVVSNQN